MENEHSPYDIEKQEATQASNDLTARLLRESEEADFKYQMMAKEAQERAELKEMKDDNRGE